MQKRKRIGLALLGAVLLAGSCYNPNFGQVLYKCGPESACPDGLMCIDGTHCTYATMACNQGGIMIAANTYVCPGGSNGCGGGFRRCSNDVVSNLCHLDVSDAGMAEQCLICCADFGDMRKSPPPD